MNLTKFLYCPISLAIDSSESNIPYGSCCRESLWNTSPVFELGPVSALKLVEKFVDRATVPDFSSSITLEVRRSLTKMKMRHFIMFSDNLFGCHL